LEALRSQMLNAQGNQRGEQAEKDHPSPHVSDESETGSCGDYKGLDEHPSTELPASRCHHCQPASTPDTINMSVHSQRRARP
jgi:hypothetical protein